MEVKLIGYSVPVYEKTDDGVEYLAEIAASKCRNGEPSMKALTAALDSSHDSVVEHIQFTFEVSGVSRACLGQFVRHRLASFSVMSQRYVDQTKIPAVVPHSIMENEQARELFASIEAFSVAGYEKLLQLGIPKEDARFALLEAKQTSMVVSMNCRELLHFFSLRCCKRAQWEIYAVAWKMLDICQTICPTIFKDAGPGCVRGFCPEGHPCGNPVAGGTTHE